MYKLLKHLATETPSADLPSTSNEIHQKGFDYLCDYAGRFLAPYASTPIRKGVPNLMLSSNTPHFFRGPGQSQSEPSIHVTNHENKPLVSNDFEYNEGNVKRQRALKSWQTRRQKAADGVSSQKRTVVRSKRFCMGCKNVFPSSYFKKHVLQHCKELRKLGVSEKGRLEIVNMAPTPQFATTWEKIAVPKKKKEDGNDSSNKQTKESENEKEHNDLFNKLKESFLCGRDDRFGTAPKRSDNTLVLDKTHLESTLKAANINNIEDLFNYQLWEKFLAGEGLAKSSIKTRTRKLGYGTQHARLLAMIRFFGMFNGRTELLSPSQVENGVKIKKLLDDALPLFNKGRVIEINLSKNKYAEEQSSVALGVHFAKFVTKALDDMPEKPLRLYIVDIFITINSYEGTRPSGLSFLTLKEWSQRHQAVDGKYKGWVQVQVAKMKNSISKNPYVSIDPLTAKKINFFIKYLRPKNDLPYVFVTREKSVNPLYPSYASYVVNHFLYRKWREIMSPQYPKLPKTFRFNTQRHCIQTETRHNPRKEQPAQELFNQMLLHGEGAAYNTYMKRVNLNYTFLSVNYFCKFRHLTKTIWALLFLLSTRL